MAQKLITELDSVGTSLDLTDELIVYHNVGTGQSGTEKTGKVTVGELKTVLNIPQSLNNILDGNSTGSVRTSGSSAKSSSYTIGSFAFTQGLTTKASGQASHAEGYETSAAGNYSHSEGGSTSASGNYAHAEGGTTFATGNYAHAEGNGTNAGFTSHAEGSGTTASGNYSHSQGYISQATGNKSHAEGSQTLASGISSHAEGSSSTINNVTKKVEASGEASHAEGISTTAAERASHAEGYGTIARGSFSHAEGNGSETAANAMGAHAEGESTIASGTDSHAEGFDTEASGDAAHAEGWETEASGDAAHVEGISTIASGTYSHAEGLSTIAQRKSQHVFGQYNIADTTGTTTTKGNYIQIVGNGDSNANRSNARTLDWSGNEVLAGSVTAANATAVTQLPTVNQINSLQQTLIGSVSLTSSTTGGDVISQDINTFNRGGFLCILFFLTKDWDNYSESLPTSKMVDSVQIPLLALNSSTIFEGITNNIEYLIYENETLNTLNVQVAGIPDGATGLRMDLYYKPSIFVFGG